MRFRFETKDGPPYPRIRKIKVNFIYESFKSFPKEIRMMTNSKTKTPGPFSLGIHTFHRKKSGDSFGRCACCPEMWRPLFANLIGLSQRPLARFRFDRGAEKWRSSSRNPQL